MLILINCLSLVFLIIKCYLDIDCVCRSNDVHVIISYW